MLTGDDAVTQALLESFLAESSKEAGDVNPAPPTMANQISSSLKLTQQIEVRCISCNLSYPFS